MTLSLAFLSPPLVQDAIERGLPRGLWLLEERPFGAIPDRGGLLHSLNDVQRRAKAALDSPNVATKEGTAPKG